ncbi:hypothetical protein HNR72_000865 [Streptomyces collinus]|uniref:Uncharacterized protein n=1 Tax=Streptomyces collinus TaxID=42684 RepID=A0AA89PV56_STRCU|nr:hypothetical protein [Streptomyces collinus]
MPVGFSPWPRLCPSNRSHPAEPATRRDPVTGPTGLPVRLPHPAAPADPAHRRTAGGPPGRSPSPEARCAPARPCPQPLCRPHNHRVLDVRPPKSRPLRRSHVHRAKGPGREPRAPDPEHHTSRAAGAPVSRTDHQARTPAHHPTPCSPLTGSPPTHSPTSAQPCPRHAKSQSLRRPTPGHTPRLHLTWPKTDPHSRKTPPRDVTWPNPTPALRPPPSETPPPTPPSSSGRARDRPDPALPVRLFGRVAVTRDVVRLRSRPRPLGPLRRPLRR